jgi:hypothetical protein
MDFFIFFKQYIDDVFLSMHRNIWLYFVDDICRTIRNCDIDIFDFYEEVWFDNL